MSNFVGNDLEPSAKDESGREKIHEAINAPQL
jgi:hypothetical protein